MKRPTAAQVLGARGGRARAKRLTREERRAIAALGGRARSLSFHAAQRINENFRYVQAIEALQKGRPPVVKLRTTDDPLPDAKSRGTRHGRRPRNTSR